MEISRVKILSRFRRKLVNKNKKEIIISVQMNTLKTRIRMMFQRLEPKS